MEYLKWCYVGQVHDKNISCYDDVEVFIKKDLANHHGGLNDFICGVFMQIEASKSQHDDSRASFRDRSRKMKSRTNRL